MRRGMLISLLLLSGCVHAQKQGWGGTGTVGGLSGLQSSTAPTLQILTNSLPNAVIGVAYSQTATSQFGIGALTWALDSGSLPTGVTLNTSTGVISGTPTNNAAIFNFVLKVTDSSSPTPQVAKQPLSISVLCTVLQILSPLTMPTADQGTSYNFTVQTSGGIAPLAFAATGLPTGESINASTGVISGTPSVSGTLSNIQLAVSDACPLAVQTSTETLTQTVNATLVITTPQSLQSGQVGQAYSTQIAAAGGTAPYTFAVTGSLPAGLTLNVSTGVISGTPSAPGSSGFLITVTDAIANTVSVQFTLAIACQPLSIVSLTLPNGTQGSQYSFQETAAGGFGAIAWTASLLPNGLSISSSGLLAGTPSEFGSFTPQIVATDSCPAPQTATVAPTLVLAQQIGPLVIQTTSPLPAATVGQTYNLQLQATGGLTPYRWSLNSGSFPLGLVLSGSGVVSGTASQSGSFTPVLQVADQQSTITSSAFSLTSSCPALSFSAPTLPNGTQGQTYSFSFSASGGVTPLRWSEVGTLPTGMSLSTSGVLSGTPSNTGIFSFTVTATDSCSPVAQSQSNSVSLTIAANSGALTIASTSPLPAATENIAYSNQLVAVGGTPPYAWSVSSGSTPAGVSLNSSGTISGTPTATATSTFTARVTDSILGTTTKSLSLTVSCVPLSITSSSPLPAATQNSSYSFQFTPSGGTGAINWSATGVPAGLALSSAGVLSGTPTAAGTGSISVTATDSCLPTHQTSNGSFSLTVNSPIPSLVIGTTSPLPAATEGQAYNVQMAASGGVSPYTWAKTAGSFPAGVTMNAAGLISGTPTSAGTVTPTIQDTDSQPVSASGVFSVTVNCPAFAITTTGLPPATQSTAYNFQTASTGGFSTVTWGASGLPTGLSISSGGLISGTPGSSGPFSVTLTATDSCSPTPQAISVILPLQVNTNLAITTAALGSCTVNQACSDPLNATGGTPPYTWSITSGTLQTGLSLNASTGVISGTPSIASTVTLTIKVTDSIPNNVSTSLTLTVNPVVVAGGADNRYCPATEVSTMAQDGPALPLQKCVNTALANTSSNGSTVTVTAGSLSSLQNSINAAACGQTVIIPALNGAVQDVISGNITISNKCTSAAWLTIRTSQIASLPAEGSRVSPAFIGIPSLHIACPVGSNGPNGECGRPPYSQPATPGTYMPKLLGVGNNASTVTFKGASHVRIIGLEITSPAGQANTKPQIITDGGVAADHIILDRVIVHGGNSPNFQNKTSVQAAVRFAATQYWGLIDSYIADTGCVANVVCTDSQAVFGGGQSLLPSGPGKVVDNFIETSGEEVFNGGGGAGPNTLSATDTEIRRNHLFKPMFWKSNDPSYFGTNFEIKNHLEFKNANRALIEANLFEQNWGFQSDQHGEAVHFNAFNQNLSYTGSATSDGTGKLTFVSGIQFKSDIVAPTCSIANHCLVKYNGVLYRALTWISGTQITVNTLATGAGTVPPVTGSASFTAAEPGENPSATVSNVTMRYNRVSHAGNGIEITDPFSDNGDVAAQSGGYSLHDNVLDDIDGGRWELGGSQACCNWGYGFEVFENYPAPLNEHDISIWHNTALGTASTGGSTSQGSAFGAGNSVAGLLKNARIYDNLGSGGWANLGAFGTSAQISWNNWTPVAQKCWDNNFLATSTTATSGVGSFTKINLPYPAPADNGFCPYGTPKGNTVVTSFATFQFTLLNGANGGNYLLLNTSPYKGLASDGTDPGANINSVNTNLAGVQ